MGVVLKRKHLVLDQQKINAAKRYFEVDSEQEAIDKTLSLLVVMTKNGGKHTPFIDAERVDHYHLLKRKHIHIGLLQEAIKGVIDLTNVKTLSLDQLKSRHGQ